MSDPVTNAEVEDVLSSIRRLVSEDRRPVQVPKAEAKSAGFNRPEPKLAEPKNDRLVLTPALRVSETPRDVAPSKTLVLNSPQTVQPESLAEETVFDESQDATDENEEIDIASLITDDTPLDMHNLLLLTEETTEDITSESEAERDDAPKSEAHLLGDQSRDYSTDPYNFENEADDGVSDDSYLLQFAATQRRPADGVEDVEDVDGFASEETSAFSDVSETAILIESESPAVEQDASEQGNAPDAATTGSELSNAETPIADAPAAMVKAAALTAKIAALETAIGQIAETWEPDDAGESDYAGSEAEAMAWEDEEQELTPPAEAKAPVQKTVTPDSEVAELGPEEFFAKPQPVDVSPSEADMTTANTVEAESMTSTAAPADDGLDFTDEEQLIDEEALRDLVSDIVRTELQGALGERITRNVRKLVRREIHRALAAQDLE